MWHSDNSSLVYGAMTVIRNEKHFEISLTGIELNSLFWSYVTMSH